MDPRLLDRLVAARGDPTLAVLEGAHAVKHAVRFRAELEMVVTPDRERLLALLDELASDVVAAVDELAVQVDAASWQRLAPRGLPSPALGLARRPAVDRDAVLATPGPAPVVLLEEPTHLGNVGAVVRVAAAAGAAGVLTVGRADPWAPAAIRGAAGLQFAVPTLQLEAVPAGERPVVAVDPAGEPLGTTALPAGALLAFGTERRGLSEALLAQAATRVRIPMRPGVSSLNLATAAAVALYLYGAATGPGYAAGDVPPEELP